MKSRQTLSLLTAFLLAASFLPIIAITSEPVQAQPPENTTTRSFGNLDLPDWKDVTVEDTADFIIVNNDDNLIFKFAKGTVGTTQILQNGNIIVEEERWIVQYLKEKNWVQRGNPRYVEWEQPENYHVIVRRFYRDWGEPETTFWVIYDFYGGFRPKISVEMEVGQEDNYRIAWKASGINKTYVENGENYVRLWNENEEAVVFDYSDVYEAFGDITEVEIEPWANNHKLNEYFYVGYLEVENFRLDPTFGYETAEVSVWNWQNSIQGSAFSCPEAGTADNITAYVGATGDWTGPVKAAIYTVSDENLVGYTEERTESGVDWFTFDIIWGGSLEAEDYILCLWTSGNASFYFGSGEVETEYIQSLTYGDWPDPASFGLEYMSNKYCIYCTYTLPPPSPGKPVLVSPENQYLTSDNTPTFKWENGSDATSHRLVIDNSQNFDDGENIYDNANAWDNSGTTIENELPMGNYYWRVWAVNPQGENCSENTWQFELAPLWIDSIAVDNSLVDKEMDYVNSGATLQTRIYVVAEGLGRDYLDNVYFWIRDSNDAVVVDNEMHQGYENIDENTKRFWFDYDPDAMADGALGKFDVKAQVVATDSMENTKDYTDFGYELFVVNDLSLPSPTVDDPTPYKGQTIRVSGSVSRVYGTASLDSAWVMDQTEGVLTATVVGNAYTKEYLVTSETGTKVSVHVRAFDAGSGLDGISPSVSYTVAPIPIPWVMLVLGAYEDEGEEPGVAPEFQPGTYIGSEWVPRDWFYLGETCFLRALVRDAETRDPIALATVAMKIEYEGRKFTVLNPELGLYEGHLLLENIPLDHHVVNVDVYAAGYARWDGAAVFTVAPAPVVPPPPVEEKPALPAPEPIDPGYWPLLPVFALALALVWPKARWDRTPRNWDSRSPPGSWTFIHEPRINIVLLALCGLMLAFVYFVSGLTSFVAFYGAMVAVVALIIALELANPSAPTAFVGLGFPSERPRLALAGIFLGALIFLAAGIAVKVFGITFEAVPRVTVPFFSAELIPNLLMTGTLVPLIEEKFFRGVFTSFLAERTGILLAVGLGGVTFGAAHWVFGGGIPLALFATFFGGVVGWLMLRQQSLLLGIATHMTYNTLVVLVWMGYLGTLGGMLPW